MTMDFAAVELVLKRAIESGEILEIIYMGGSQPGSKRSIAPIKLFDNKVRARCYSSDAVKVFMVEKIQLDVSKAKIEGYETVDPDLAPDNLNDALEPFRSEIASYGWTIEDLDEEACLYRFYKNGNRRKRADVYIYFVPPDESPSSPERLEISIGCDERGEIAVEQIPQQDRKVVSRPWRVVSAKLNEGGRSYKDINAAVRHFVSLAKRTAEELGLLSEN